MRGPARSLSANATPVLMGPRAQRKAQSARAVASGAKRPRTAEGAVHEEEDVPLALWQQQQHQQQSVLSQQPRRR